MPNPKTPSFIRDLDQGAELAALLQDSADEMEGAARGEAMTRRERTRYDQTVARYRRWASELSPDGIVTPVPLQVRPANWANDPAARAETLAKEHAERQGANREATG